MFIRHLSSDQANLSISKARGNYATACRSGKVDKLTKLSNVKLPSAGAKALNLAVADYLQL
ncbi:hypothetical protein PITC_084870 [Penicillium italicum]|uniref:Uncharacterized protein n=1 Tax=Penicillium italicum TaxID=40296 RepID=A0A0A2LCA8_PENIT|nr:hypothetical protein PITC_084870 [Penicillium italicum]